MESVQLFFDQEIDVDLPLSGHRLIPGYSVDMGLPVELYLRLYAVSKESEITLIAEPSDLSRIVTRVGNDEAAWRFLQLFTAPATHYFFQKGDYTIDLSQSSACQPVELGMIAPELARRVGYEPPEIRLKDGEYITRRDLVRANATNLLAPATVLRRREALSERGIYRFISDQVIGNIERVDVPFPSYE